MKLPLDCCARVSLLMQADDFLALGIGQSFVWRPMRW